MALEIRTAAELIDPELEARWTTRRVARETAVLQQAKVTFDPARISVDQLIQAVNDAGFGASLRARG